MAIVLIIVGWIVATVLFVWWWIRMKAHDFRSDDDA